MLRMMCAISILLLTIPALCACAGSSSADVERRAMPWWGWLLIILAIVALACLIWRRLSRRRAWATGDSGAMAVQVAEPIPDDAAAPMTWEQAAAVEPTPLGEPEAAGPAAREPVMPDDLKRVEGIGPKVSGLLNGAGIATFAQLAAADVDQVRAVLGPANLRMIDPSSWPQQASLAADGKWEELAALQDALKGGRRA